ncbi:putative selenium-binding protein, partial [Operophtera brumata]
DPPYLHGQHKGRAPPQRLERVLELPQRQHSEERPAHPACAAVIDGSEMRSFNCSFPHTTHCLATGEIMISTMGDKEENGKGDFVLIDAKTLKVTGEEYYD